MRQVLLFKHTCSAEGLLADHPGWSVLESATRFLKIEKLSILRLPAVEIEVKGGEAISCVRPSSGHTGPGPVIWRGGQQIRCACRLIEPESSTRRQAHLSLKRSAGGTLIKDGSGLYGCVQ